MNDEELLKAMKLEWTEQLHFFSNAGMQERERWVVSTFLRGLSLPFDPAEIRSHPQDSPVDAEFRQAHFQIKEIVTPGERRQAEITSTFRRVQAATTLKGTLMPGFVYDTPPIADGYMLVRDEATALANSPKYLDGPPIRGQSITGLWHLTRPRCPDADD